MKFALFELFCLMICFAITTALAGFGVFNSGFLMSGGLWKAGWTLFGLWFILSSVALVRYRWGMELGTYIVSAAIIASPFSTMIFCAGFRMDAGFPSLALLTLISALLGLTISLGIIKTAELLEDKIYPIFRILGF